MAIVFQREQGVVFIIFVQVRNTIAKNIQMAKAEKNLRKCFGNNCKESLDSPNSLHLMRHNCCTIHCTTIIKPIATQLL